MLSFCLGDVKKLNSNYQEDEAEKKLGNYKGFTIQIEKNKSGFLFSRIFIELEFPISELITFYEKLMYGVVNPVIINKENKRKKIYLLIKNFKVLIFFYLNFIEIFVLGFCFVVFIYNLNILFFNRQLC